MKAGVWESGNEAICGMKGKIGPTLAYGMSHGGVGTSLVPMPPAFITCSMRPEGICRERGNLVALLFSTMATRGRICTTLLCGRRHVRRKGKCLLVTVCPDHCWYCAWCYHCHIKLPQSPGIGCFHYFAWYASAITGCTCQLIVNFLPYDACRCKQKKPCTLIRVNSTCMYVLIVRST